jgi:hypothetical protein
MAAADGTGGRGKRRTGKVWTLRDRYAVAGIGCTAYSADSGTTVLNLALEACRDAAADAGMELAEIDGVVSFHFGDSVPSMPLREVVP